MALLDVDQWSVDHWMTYVAVCMRCDSKDYSVQLWPAATEYVVLNEPVMLCERCAVEYYAFWREMWLEARR